MNGAIESKDYKKLKTALKLASEGSFGNQLTTELINANELLENLQEIENYKYKILKLDGRHIVELHNINPPSNSVHAVIKAVLLIFSVPEIDSEKWTECQIYIKYVSSHSLLKKIDKLNILKIHPGIILRADEILSIVDLKHVQEESKGAAAIFIWLKQTLMIYKKVYHDQISKFKPANKEDQMRFFGRKK